MFDYLQKFNNLPKNLRDKVSSSEAMKTISSLENKYKVDLASVVMKVMTKTLAVDDLLNFFVSNFSLSKEKSLALKNDLIDKVFFSVKDYLNIESEDVKSKDVKSEEVKDVKHDVNDFSSAVIKETGISFASEDLYLRLRNIILTYLKGIRNRLDTKNSLTKEVRFGGLNLSEKDADNIFSVISSIKKQEREKAEERVSIDLDNKDKDSSDISSRAKLDRIIMSAEASSYDFNKLKSSTDKNERKRLSSKESENKMLAAKDSKVKTLADKKPFVAIKESKPTVLLSNTETAQEDKKEKAEQEKEEKKFHVPENLPIEDIKAEIKEDAKDKTVSEEKDALVADKKESFTKDKIVVASDSILADVTSKDSVTSVDKKEEVVHKVEELSKNKEEGVVVKKEEIKKEKLDDKKDNKRGLQDNSKDLDKKLSKEDRKEEAKPKAIEKKEAKRVEENEAKDFEPSKILNLNLKRSSIPPVKNRIQDIKPVTKIVSPIDELRLINLVNFRRLGNSPKEIVLKIFSKIKLLEKDGYDKMIKGVKAWRQSQVNHLYIKMGQEVIIRNSSYLEVINKRKEAKMPYLTIDEINAISQLNSKLSF